MKVDQRIAITSLIIGFMGVLFTVVFYFRDHQPKSLSVQTISVANLANLADPALSALRLTYNGDALTRVTAVTFEISNPGTQPLQSRDFERPLALIFDGDHSVLSASVSDRTPKNLAPEITTHGQTVSIAPLLLNPTDRFHLNLVLRGEFSVPEIDARVLGVSTVTAKPLPVRAAQDTGTGVYMLVLGFLCMVGYGYLAMYNESDRMKKSIHLLLPFAGALLLTVGSDPLQLSFWRVLSLALLSMILSSVLTGWKILRKRQQST